MDKTTLLQNFQVEVGKSLIMTDDDKSYWLKAAEGLNPEILESVYNMVKDRNEMISGYIRVALQHDPDQQYLNELKTKIKELKKNTLQIEEKSTQPNAEDELAQKLAEL